METQELARTAFALGYAETGAGTPSRRVEAACLSCQEIALKSTGSGIGRLIVEAGRTEGKRNKREAAHRRLYTFHAAQLAAAIGKILQRIDQDPVVHHLLDVAQSQAAADATPMARRRAVAGAALVAINAQVHADDRLELDTLNAAGWAHATAYGTGEAKATPVSGGPPDLSKVAAGAAVALRSVAHGDANAVTQGWTDIELQSIAMGAAIKAGDGTTLADASRSVSAALVDSGRATRAYADQLHGAVIDAFVASTQADLGPVLYDWVTADDPCDDCEDYELEGPYQASDIPQIPVHPNCLCSIEVEKATAGQLVDA